MKDWRLPVTVIISLIIFAIGWDLDVSFTSKGNTVDCDTIYVPATPKDPIEPLNFEDTIDLFDDISFEPDTPIKEIKNFEVLAVHDIGTLEFMKANEMYYRYGMSPTAILSRYYTEGITNVALMDSICKKIAYTKSDLPNGAPYKLWLPFLTTDIITIQMLEETIEEYDLEQYDRRY